MTLEQLMAFPVTENHAHQEQVWDQLNNGQHISAHDFRALRTSSIR
jgi:ParB family transcriptional regulator, chromosome partitioning protein